MPAAASVIGTTVALTSFAFSTSFRRFSVVVPFRTAIFLPPRSAIALIGVPALTRNPPPSKKIRFEKSTVAKRACVCVVLAHSRSARPAATICRRSVTEPESQFVLRFGSPTVRPICAMIRLHRSIE